MEQMLRKNAVIKWKGLVFSFWFRNRETDSGYVHHITKKVQLGPKSFAYVGWKGDSTSHYVKNIKVYDIVFIFAYCSVSGYTRRFYCNSNSRGSDLQGIGQILSP